MPAEHIPTLEARKKVESYAAVGIPQADIARILQIDPKTLRLHYRDELDLSAAKANAAIGGKLYTEAMAGNPTLLIWWTKARMRWREKTEVEHTGRLAITDESMSVEEATRLYEQNLKSLRDDG